MKFMERITDIKPDILSVLETSNTLKESKQIQKLFEIILSIGNYMNSASFRGQAYGFSIDLLLKLGDTKSSLGRHNFLHYLAKVVDKKFPELIDMNVNFLNLLEKPSRGKLFVFIIYNFLCFF